MQSLSRDVLVMSIRDFARFLFFIPITTLSAILDPVVGAAFLTVVLVTTPHTLLSRSNQLSFCFQNASTHSLYLFSRNSAATTAILFSTSIF